MTADERTCLDHAMEHWKASTNRPDLVEADRVKGALLAYQRMAVALALPELEQSK
jgi:hypothetical protein